MTKHHTFHLSQFVCHPVALREEANVGGAVFRKSAAVVGIIKSLGQKGNRYLTMSLNIWLSLGQHSLTQSQPQTGREVMTAQRAARRSNCLRSRG